MEFEKNIKYKIQKDAVGEYLQHDLFDMLFNYTVDNYQLPKMNEEELSECRYLLEGKAPDMQKAIFSNDKVAKRFIEELGKNFAYNGSDSFTYTCRFAAENTLFYYSPKDKKHSRKMERIFNPVLDNLANDVALGIEDNLTLIRESKKNEEIALMERIAKKHSRKLK